MSKVNIAIVEFQIIDIPVGERLSVDIIMVFASWISGASFRTYIFIDRQFQTACVHLKKTLEVT
jgi:hypothetical protein